ncbi:MAG: helix-hairpin-helix domain-containing protein [Terriglobia bacterium]
MASELLNISGIGEKTANKLLSHFGSLSALQSLSPEELGQVVNPSQAKRIFEYLAMAKRPS